MLENNRTWPVMPDIVEELLLEWNHTYPSLTRLDSVTGHTGYKTYAISVTDPSVPETSKVPLLLIQPHGHEPSQTAAAMDILCQLLTGKTLVGEKSDLEQEEVLRRLVLVINPLGNPDGRLRTPTECWTEEYTFQEGCYYWNGKLRGDTDYFSQIGRFRRAEYDFDPDYPIALRYEQVDEDLYSDAWNDPAEKLEDNPTSLAALIRTMMNRYRFQAILDLHQYPEADFVHVWIPTLSDPEAQKLSERLADKVHEDWAAIGYHVRWPHRYDMPGFIKAVHEYGSTWPAIITLEIGAGVGHHNAIMDRETQRGAAVSAIRSALRFFGEL